MGKREKTFEKCPGCRAMGRSGKFHSHFPGCTVKKADEERVLRTTALADKSIEARYHALERASIYRLDPVCDGDGNIVGWE